MSKEYEQYLVARTTANTAVARLNSLSENKDSEITRLQTVNDELRALLEQDEPVIDSPWPFEAAEPETNTARIVSEVWDKPDNDIVGPGQGFSDTFWADCDFNGATDNNAFGLRKYKGQPELRRCDFEHCRFTPTDRYAFWCDGIMEDVVFRDCVFNFSTAESTVRFYNGRRIVFINCTFITKPGINQKAALRSINSDQIAFINCKFIGGGLWINQPLLPGGGWFGRHYILDCEFDHWSTSSKPIRIEPSLVDLPVWYLSEIIGALDPRISIKNVTSNSTTRGRMISPWAAEQFCTIENCTHNGEPVPSS